MGLSGSPGAGAPPARRDVLFVEAAAEVRQVGMAMLSALGYTPLATAPHAAARTLAERRPALAAVVVHGLRDASAAAALVVRLRAAAPEVPVIVAAPLIEPEISALLASDACRFLPTPYRLRALADALEAATAPGPADM